MLYLVFQSIDDNIPFIANRTGAPALMDFEQIFRLFDTNIQDVDVYQLTYNVPMSGGALNEFLSHPNHDIPVKFEMISNMIRLSFNKGTTVHQVEYFGTSLRSKVSNISAPPFNVLIYYRINDANWNTWETESVRLTNLHRTANNLPVLAFSKKASWISRLKAIDMAANSYFDHNSPYYGNPSQLIRTFGTPNVNYGEILVKGGMAFTPQSAFMVWKNSPVHNKIMLNSDLFNILGAGCVLQTDQGTYWVQEFNKYYDGLEDSFNYGNDLKLQPSYENENAIVKTNMPIIVGIVIAIVVVLIGIGCITAIVVIKKRNEVAVQQIK
ncbi:SCP-like extracellular protein [Spironucleus salmonicida]|uniref:SCP-like extracellular protein n=1 Tax=Spironucleus salmonicida TaxID=348837 RepID=V6LTW7_9EUKA|nr:SCP-like extracellular protein [Spironucleus salmonicida]|eukprot:EST48045.1 SCP-like extracellular protein [Spironucleus salmonicida]